MIGDFPGALNDINKAIEIKPDEGSFYETRFQLRMFTGKDNVEALKDLDFAIANGARHERIYNSRGMIRMMTNDVDGAIADYELVIGMNPSSPRGHLGLSSVYRAKGDTAKATQILEAYVLTLENSRKRIGTVKGEVSASTFVEVPLPESNGVKVGQETVIYKGPAVNGPMTPERAQAMSDKLENTKNTAAVYIGLAQDYEKSGKFSLALETVEKGLVIDRFPHGFGVRGTIKVRLRDYAGAIEDLSKGISGTPQSADFFLNRGIAFLMLDSTEAAETDFRTFLQLAPTAKDKLEQRKKEALENPQQH
jgi:tetratricopeptide (TPR) repeat protein